MGGFISCHSCCDKIGLWSGCWASFRGWGRNRLSLSFSGAQDSICDNESGFQLNSY